MRWVALLVLLVLSVIRSAAIDDTTVVARVGRYTITTADLLSSYDFGPAFVRLAQDPLRKHLEYMIYERLLANDAEDQGEANTPFVRERIDGLEEDLAVDQLYNEEILGNVQISESDIQAGTQKLRINLRLRWIYAEESDALDRLVSALASGIPFESLYLDQKEAGGPAFDHSVQTTLLELERDNPEIAVQIAGLQNQEISPPIRGPDGFYIVRVDEIWQNPLMTSTAEAEMRAHARKTLVSIRADALAREYIRKIMVQASPVIKAEGFNILRAYLAQRGLSKNTRLTWQIPGSFMTEAGPVPLDRSWEFVHRPVVVSGHDVLTVRDYLRWFDIRQFQLKTSSLRAFNASIKATIWKLVHDRHLSAEARRRGLFGRDTVRLETTKWKIKLLYLAARMRLVKSISISDSAVEARHRTLAEQYREAAGEAADLSSARSHVHAVLFQERETEILLREIQRLRRNIVVHVREDIVKELAASVQEEGPPINVVFYKPGGTFPRVAFPTIDEAWERLGE